MAPSKCRHCGKHVSFEAKIGLIAFCLFFSGCATIATTPAVEKVGVMPALGESASAPIGGTIFTQYKYLARDVAVATSSATTTLGLGRVVVTAGDAFLPVSLNGRTAFCSEKRTYIDPLTGPHTFSCLIDANNDGAFEKVTASPGGTAWLDADLFPPVQYTRSEQVTPRSGSFKYELLYQGISQKTLKVSYREFVDDLARPAYFQDVTYDIQAFPMTVTFRSVRIQVTGADNNQISYRVLSKF